MYTIEKIDTAEQTFTVHCPVCDETTNGGTTGTLPTITCEYFIDNCDKDIDLWSSPDQDSCPECGHKVNDKTLIDDTVEEVWNAAFLDYIAAEEARGEAYRESKGW